MQESRCAEVGLQGCSVTRGIAAEGQLLGSSSTDDGSTGRLMEGHRPSRHSHQHSVTSTSCMCHRLHSIPYEHQCWTHTTVLVLRDVCACVCCPQALAADKAAAAHERELEVARLRALQEKVQDTRSQEDELRAKRYQVRDNATKAPIRYIQPPPG